MYCITCSTNISGRLDNWCNKCHEEEMRLFHSDYDIAMGTIETQKETIRKRNILIKDLRTLLIGVSKWIVEILVEGKVQSKDCNGYVSEALKKYSK